MIGSVAQIADDLIERRERFGFSFVTVSAADIERVRPRRRPTRRHLTPAGQRSEVAAFFDHDDAFVADREALAVEFGLEADAHRRPAR